MLNLSLIGILRELFLLLSTCWFGRTLSRIRPKCILISLILQHLFLRLRSCILISSYWCLCLRFGSFLFISCRILLLFALSLIAFSFSCCCLLRFSFVLITKLILIKMKLDINRPGGCISFSINWPIVILVTFRLDLALASFVDNRRLQLIWIRSLIRSNLIDIPSHIDSSCRIIIIHLCWHIYQGYLGIIHSNICDVHIDINWLVGWYSIALLLLELTLALWLISMIRAHQFTWLLLIIHLQWRLGTASWPCFRLLLHFLLCFSAFKV